MNYFDAAVYFCIAVAVFSGYHAGLLRSLATILGYLAAAPVAVAVSPLVTQFLADRNLLPPNLTWLVPFSVLIVAGFLFGALLRKLIGGLTGGSVSLPDRVLGAALGAVRVLLVAVLIVMIFDAIIPAGREPDFLKRSQLRPLLSAAGQQGLRSLPPDVSDYIARLKRERGL